MFVEKDCVIEHEGKKFESGGAFICLCTDGYIRGVVYSTMDQESVTTWHGEKIADAEYGPEYRGNFCKMQAVTFEHGGVKFHGRYCPDWSQMIRVRSTKKVGVK